MSGSDRRRQILAIAAEEFAENGLHGASTEAIARRAEITQAYVFRLFGTKRALFLELVVAAFDRLTEAMSNPACEETALVAAARLGEQDDPMLAERTALLLQLQGFAACGDPEVREVVRERFAKLWQTVAEVTALDPTGIRAFLGFEMLLGSGLALQCTEVDEPWAHGMRTRVNPRLFDHAEADAKR